MKSLIPIYNIYIRTKIAYGGEANILIFILSIFPLTAPFFFDSTLIDILVSQQEVIRKLASNGDCIIVGRSADVLMEDMNPFKIFVYADEKSKVKRSLER